MNAALDNNHQNSRDDAIDRDLLRSIVEERDGAAMEQFYNRYRSRLTPFLYRLTRDEALLEETYNDVMLKVWRKAHQYKGQSLVSSWVFSIGYRVCLRALKKDRKHVHDDLEGQSELYFDDSASAAFNQKALRGVLTTLSPNHRMVLELAYFQGYSTQEIANIVGRPVNTVKTRLHHARSKMREGLLAGGNSNEFK